jgi:hypothetical protein
MKSKSKLEETGLSLKELYPDKEFKWAIKFDEHLNALLEAQDITDPDEQQTVCDALVALGLADHKMYSDHNKTLYSQEHHYASTVMMKVLAAEYLYSTKHWTV